MRIRLIQTASQVFGKRKKVNKKRRKERREKKREKREKRKPRLPSSAARTLTAIRTPILKREEEEEKRKRV